MELTSLLVLAVVGLVIGVIAGMLMKNGGFGLVGDMIVGILGMVVGGWLAGVFGISFHGLVGQIIVGVVGACVLLFVLRLLKKNS